MKNYIKGKFKRTIFSSDNGYIIGNIKIKETNEDVIIDLIDKEITFTGYFADLNLNDDYILYGEIIEHPRYGIQYKVYEYERIMPDDKDGIVEFLSSDLFPGIGEKLAVRIVDTLGNATLDKILEDKENLKKVSKITEKKINTIYSVLTKYEESHKIVVYLTELGFNMKDSLNIYNRYKTDTVITIENNIYDIIDEIDEISFLKVDEVAKKLEFLNDDIRRIKACVIYIMKQLTFKTGDTYLLYEDIKRETLKYLNFYIDDEQFILILDELRFETKIVLENNVYYLKEIYLSENSIISKIKILNSKKGKKYDKINDYLKQLEHNINVKYNDQQILAIKKALENNLLIINGGPGTGKTTIIKAITNLYMELNELSLNDLDKIALLAPTGRASKRMSEITNLPATTIHRFLKWDKDTNTFNVDEYNKSNSEFVIIDEASMIDINLLGNLFNGLKDNIQIILVGDYNQLPSVGPGNVLKDLIQSNIIDVVELKELYRQSDNSYINKLAIEIKNNELTDFLSTKDDYAFLKCSSNSIVPNLVDLCKKIVSKGCTNVQIMAPMYSGVNGIDNLNKELQNVFNPKDNEKQELKYGDIIFRENDKVLQLVNMPDENVFNGDIGYIKYIIPSSKSESKKNEVYVDFDGNIVKYLPSDLIKLKHGFIISVHKAQGSEFEFVILPICKDYSRMLYRKLIYTAVTRAKKKLIFIGDDNALLYGVNNDNERIRNTALKEKLQKMYNS